MQCHIIDIDATVSPAPPRVFSGKGKGIIQAKRHKQNGISGDNFDGITKPAIRRLFRRANVKHNALDMYSEMRGTIKAFLDNLVPDVLAHAEHSRRKTVSAMDVVHAMKLHGYTGLGFTVKAVTTDDGENSVPENAKYLVDYGQVARFTVMVINMLVQFYCIHQFSYMILHHNLYTCFWLFVFLFTLLLYTVYILANECIAWKQKRC